MAVGMNQLNTVQNLASFKKFTIGALNVRSIHNSFDEIVRLLHDSDLDCFCVNETWMTDSHYSDHCSCPGYNLFRHDRTRESGKRTGGGVAIYIKDNVNVLEMNNFCKCTPHIEILWTKIKFVNSRPYYIASIYRSRVSQFQSL